MNKDQLAARLLATFIAELDDQVRAMNADLLALAAHPADTERLKSLFRVAHTLKGAARAAGVPPVELACHALETLLAETRDGKRSLGQAELALLCSAADALGDAGKRLKAGRDLAGSPLAALHERLKGAAPNAPPSQIPATNDEIAYAIAVRDDLLAGTPSYVSPQVERILGYAPQEFLSDPMLWFRLLHPDDVAAVRESTRRLADDRRPRVRTYRLRQKRTDAYRWFEDRTVPTRDALGRLTGYSGIARDITERVQGEAQLRFQADILRSVRDSVIVMDVEGRIEYWNPGATAVFGYTAEEMLGQTPARLYPDQDPEQLAADLRNIAAGQDYMGERKGRRKDGAVVWVDIKMTLMRGAGDRATGFIAVAKEVSLRREAEERLQANEQRSRQVFNHLPLPTFVWQQVGDDFVLRDFNEAAAAFTRGGVARFVGRSSRNIYPDLPEISDDLARCLREDVRIRRPMVYRFRLVPEIRSIIASFAPLQPDTVLVHVEDVTERAAAEDALRESEERYRLLLRHSIEAVYRYDPETDRVLEANPAFLKLLGYTAAEVQALSLYDFIAHDKRDIQAVLQRVLASGSLAIGTRSWRRKDGSIVDVDVTASVVPQRGKASVFFVGRDISARQEAERALQRSRSQLRDLARSLRAAREEERAHIARIIHDEMGHALSALRMDLSWLRGHLPRQSRLFVQKITAMMEQIDATIAQGRTLASELRPAVLDVLGLVPGIEWELKQFGRRTGLRCVLAAPDEPPPLDPGRSTDLFRILQEALTNIAQHAEARSVHVTLRSGPTQIALEVLDDGRGISEVEISSPGALGLAGMRERALAWGGTVHIVGRPGEGTSVTVCLPMPPTTPSQAG